MPRAKIALNGAESTESQAPATPTAGISAEQASALLARIEQLEKQAKSNSAQVTTKQEMYKGPRSYSFKTLDSRPICSIKMLTNRVTRSYDSRGYVEDQTVELTFPNGEKEKMTYVDFAQGYQTSDKIFAQNVEDEIEFELKNEMEDRVVNGHTVRTNKVVKMDSIAFERRYMVTNKEGAKVINWDEIKSYKNVSRYTFLVPNVNEGKEFTVDDSAIN